MKNPQYWGRSTVDILLEDCGSLDAAIRYAERQVFMARANGNAKFAAEYGAALERLFCLKQEAQ